MNNNGEKYFIPNIEDIRIGYECEINYSLGYTDKYVKTIIKLKEEDDSCCDDVSTITIMMDDGYGEVRTLFLTKEQIEQEGYRTDYISDTGMYFFFDDITHILKICDYNGDMSYNGECKSINEFRYICKLLKI